MLFYNAEAKKEASKIQWRLFTVSLQFVVCLGMAVYICLFGERYEDNCHWLQISAKKETLTIAVFLGCSEQEINFKEFGKFENYTWVPSFRFPGSSVVKNLPTNAGDPRAKGSASGSGRSPGGGRGKTLLYSCLENPMNRGAWWAAVHGITKQTRLSNWAHTLGTFQVHTPRKH